MRTQPAEDIDAVLGRFQAWTGSRTSTESQAGIRELSYEEALRSSRYRWTGAERASAKKKLQVEPDAGRVAAEPAVEPEQRKTPQVAAKKLRTRNHAAQGVAEMGQAARANGGAAGTKASVAKASAAGKSAIKPAFREVLAEKVRPAQVMVAAQPVELARQLAISIRLAPAERALIKTRAAEAGITASAYIRQCALEVEQLREQVRQAIAALERNPAVPVLDSPPVPGLLARLARKFLPRSTQALAL